jgi:hypothetical protein
VATRRIEMDDPDLMPTDRIELGSSTEEEAAEWVEDTEIEEQAPKGHRARGVFERLERAGVEWRNAASGSVRAGTNRRRDPETARRFDVGLEMLNAGDLEGAFYTFTELLEERPHSTRLWIYVRAISQAKTAGE